MNFSVADLMAWWFGSPGYEAVALYVPLTVGVYATVQLALAPIPVSVQLSVADFGPFTWIVTTPVGVIAVPPLVSVTVTVHEIGVPSVAVFGHESEIDTLRRLTPRDVEDALVEWSVSPP